MRWDSALILFLFSIFIDVNVETLCSHEEIKKDGESFVSTLKLNSFNNFELYSKQSSLTHRLGYVCPLSVLNFKPLQLVISVFHVLNF